MTKEDAIKTLKELWRETNDPWYEEVYNMAINALEADRKTENSSEKPNNCDTCGTPKHLCKYCIEEDRMWTPKDEPQTDYGDYEKAVEHMQYYMHYEPTYNAEDGSV